MAKLYGIFKSNRSDEELWGKNQFNSTFPTALCAYMRDRGHNAIYVNVGEIGSVDNIEISFDQVFNTVAPNSELTFNYEVTYPPYHRFIYDDVGKIDLVIMHKGQYLRALEVKLTVIPDQSTFSRTEHEWGSELVIRPASTSYATLGAMLSLESQLPEIRRMFEPVGSRIRHWDNETEILMMSSEILDVLNAFIVRFQKFQKPFLLQPIWKTVGKSPILAKNAFDVFVWSDFALFKIFIDRSLDSTDSVNRYMRSSARLFRVIYEISKSGRINMESVYSQMTFGLQTDKEFALPGRMSTQYMFHDRRAFPLLGPEVVKDIILDGGQEKLSPERRFDQTLYFNMSSLF